MPAAKKTADDIQVPAEIINSFDTKELSAVFVNSSLLNSEVSVIRQPADVHMPFCFVAVTRSQDKGWQGYLCMV